MTSRLPCSVVRELAAGILTSRITYTWFLATVYECGGQAATAVSAKEQQQQLELKRNRKQKCPRFQSRGEVLRHNIASSSAGKCRLLVAGEVHDCSGEVEEENEEEDGETGKITIERYNVGCGEENQEKETCFLASVLGDLSVPVERCCYNIRAPGRVDPYQNTRHQVTQKIQNAAVCRQTKTHGKPYKRDQEDGSSSSNSSSSSATSLGSLYGRRVLPSVVTMFPTGTPARITSTDTLGDSTTALKQSELVSDAEKSALLTRIHELQWNYIHSLLLRHFKGVLTIIKVTLQEIVRLQKRRNALVPHLHSHNSSEVWSVLDKGVNSLAQRDGYHEQQQQEQQQLQSDNRVGVSTTTAAANEDMLPQVLQAFAALYRAVEFVASSKDKRKLCGIWRELPGT